MSDWTINFKESKQIWDAFASTSPQRSVFVESRFLDSLRVDYDLVTCYDKGEIVAGAVLIYSARGEPIEVGFPFTLYQGILLADNTQKPAHSQITHELKVVEYFLEKLTAHFKKFCFCQSWRLQDIRPFQWHNFHEPDKGRFKTDLRYTGILDLRNYNDFEGYLASVRTVRRQEYRKASQSLTIQFSDDTALLDALHAKTFERQSLERGDQDSALIRSICDQAIANGYGKMGVALLNGIPVSAVLFLYDDRTAYYLFGANDPSYRKSSAGSCLLIYMIKDALENDVQEVDFVGVNSPNRGDFKISFNADLKPYYVTHFDSSFAG